jgi:hypothetical protein
MEEPQLQWNHEARIKPVEQAETRALTWSLAGLGGIAIGVGGAAGLQKESGAAAAILGVSGLAVGLVCAIAALVNQPSGEDQLAADARRVLFIKGEDDFDAVTRGMTRANATVRQQCGGPSFQDQASEWERARRTVSRPVPTQAPSTASTNAAPGSPPSAPPPAPAPAPAAQSGDQLPIP